MKSTPDGYGSLRIIPDVYGSGLSDANRQPTGPPVLIVGRGAEFKLATTRVSPWHAETNLYLTLLTEGVQPEDRRPHGDDLAPA